MNIIVFGGAGLLGHAITQELRSHGHRVSTAGRERCDITVDFGLAQRPEGFRSIVCGADLVINAVGILMERGSDRFDAVHVQAPLALFSACVQERVARLIHISAAGVGSGIPGRYMASKLAAEEALTRSALGADMDWAIVRPSLLIDPASPATQLLQTLAKLPVHALPGLLRPGGALLAPIQVSDVAEAVTRIGEHPKALRRVIELAGPQIFTYRELLARLRQAARPQDRAALPLPMPWWLMKLCGLAAQQLPQKVMSIDTVRMLQAGYVPDCNEALYWLRHQPKPAVAPVNNAQVAIRLVAN